MEFEQIIGWLSGHDKIVGLVLLVEMRFAVFVIHNRIAHAERQVRVLWRSRARQERVNERATTHTDRYHHAPARS